MMMPQRFLLTQSRVNAIRIPAAGRPIYYDTRTAGLGVRVTPKGVKTLVLRRKIDGRAQMITLGRFPVIGLEQARKMADEHNGAIARGENPQDQKWKRREEATFGQLFQEYMEQHAKQTKTWRAAERHYERFLKPWTGRKAASISKHDVQLLHIRVGRANGLYMANRLLQLLHSIFERGRVWGVIEHDNPAHGIKKFLEVPRERFLQPDEMPRFFEALDQEANTSVRDFFLICLMTGARLSNVAKMRWDQVNLERATWEIPETKNGRPLTVPLHGEAVAVLQAREQGAGSEWVFPASGQRGYLGQPKRAWNRILKRAQIQGLRIHDLRRTFGSWQAATGASLTVIGKSLGHRSVVSTSIYARLNLDPVRAATGLAVDAMLAASRKKGPASGAPLRTQPSEMLP